MAWPFATVVAPSFDTGLMAVPDGTLTAASASTVYLLGAVFCNPSAAGITVTVTNTAEVELIEQEIPAGLTVPLHFTFAPCVGLKWMASTTGLKGQLYGYV